MGKAKTQVGQAMLGSFGVEECVQFQRLCNVVIVPIVLPVRCVSAVEAEEEEKWMMWTPWSQGEKVSRVGEAPRGSWRCLTPQHQSFVSFVLLSKCPFLKFVLCF